ncbi:hypothetical protein [Marinibactrum halimedae]|uniref:Uncharacterized protein n=1 Tax=Marinibactrum halimedae TaxID=1444977 RepID=A0AA37T3C5_9GAMM|nr:hypothetical protein [Marinibactrum halimedae]MCD9461097.1 hypothetical protein [Marinibactrum halimedae]GLS25748.1 hypothetical protein GCM10007877_14620 [Marinibactrum halimedae]
MPNWIRQFIVGSIESSPLPLFLVYMQFIDQRFTKEWLGPYLISSIAAVLSTGYLLSIKRPLNRLFIGINAYFLSGLISVVMNINSINQLYGIMGASAMLMWMTLMGLVITMARGSLHPEKKHQGLSETQHATTKARLTSLFFVLLCAVCTAFSWYTQGSRLMSELVPFIGLFTLHSIWFLKHNSYAD